MHYTTYTTCTTHYLKFLKPNRAIREIVDKTPHNLWVGLSDLGKEGSYRLVNGTKHDPADRSVKALYYWEGKEPNAGYDGNCVHYWKVNNGFADSDCSWYNYKGLDFHGLCEIKSYNCLDDI